MNSNLARSGNKCYINFPSLNSLYYGNVRFDTYVIYPVKIFEIFELYKSRSAYLKFHIPFLPLYLLNGHKLFGDETPEKLA